MCLEEETEARSSGVIPQDAHTSWVGLWTWSLLMTASFHALDARPRSEDEDHVEGAPKSRVHILGAM